MDYLILFLSLSILLNIEIAEALLDSLREVPAGTVLLCLGVFLTELLTSCLMMYCAVAIGNFFHGHRVLGCVGGYLILYLINQILALFFVIPMLVDPTLSAVRAQVSVSTGQYLSWFNRTLAFALVINLLLGSFTTCFLFALWTENWRSTDPEDGQKRNSAAAEFLFIFLIFRDSSCSSQ